MSLPRTAVSWRAMPTCASGSRDIRTSAAHANTTSDWANSGRRPSNGRWRCRACRMRRSPRSAMARSARPPQAATRMRTPRTGGWRLSTSTERLRGLAGIAAAMLLGACATTPEVDPMQQRVDELDARVGRIDRIVSNQSLVQMAQRMDAQQEELRKLNGRLEELQNENARLQKQQRDLYADLDRRLTNAAGTAPVAAAAGAAAGAAAAGAAATPDEQTLYARGLEQLRTRDYAAAVTSFRTLAATYPNGQMADNTQYWLGETYYVTSEFDQAAAAFQRVVTGWPNSRKVPDAMLKLGYTQIEQNKVAQARGTLQQLVMKYPDSDAAKLATERLAKLPK